MAHGVLPEVAETKTTKAMKTPPTSIKEKAPPGAEAQCYSFTIRDVADQGGPQEQHSRSTTSG